MKIFEFGARLLLFFLSINCLSTSFAATVSENVTALLANNDDVRVIVELRQPEHHLNTLDFGSVEYDTALTAQIVDAQEAVIDRLNLLTTKNLSRFTYTPQLALTADAKTLEALENDPDVVSITEDRKLKPILKESVPRIFPSSGYSKYSGKGWTVAVLDTGVDKAHPFLAGKVVAEACYSSPGPGERSVCPGGATSSTAPGSGRPCTYGGCSHGTHVAGIAAGNTSSFQGVAKNAKLIAIQVFVYSTTTKKIGAYYSDIIKGLQRVYALRNSHHIASVNLSLGGGFSTTYCDSDPTKSSIDLLKNVGIATAIASGNDFLGGGVSYPACVSTAITVGSTSDSDQESGFSNSGFQLDLFAPGENIYSSIPGGNYANYNGTSMATPHVAGAWAVMKSKDPAASVNKIQAAFKNTGLLVHGYSAARKRINISEALTKVAGKNDSPPLVPVISLLLTDHVARPPGPARCAPSNITTGVCVTGTGNDRYYAYDNTGEHYQDSANTNRIIALAPGSHILELNNEPQTVTINANQIATVHAGRVVVTGTGNDRYYVYDNTGEHHRDSALTNREIELFSKNYVLELNNEPQTVTINANQITTVHAGRVVVTGTGNDRYYVYDNTGEHHRDSALTNREIELFSKNYVLELNNEPQTVTINANQITTVHAGRVVVTGTGNDRYYVYDNTGEHHRDSALTNREIELFSKNYVLELNNEPRTVTINANQITTVHAGRVVVTGTGNDRYYVYDNTGEHHRDSALTTREIELFSGNYIVELSVGNSPYPRKPATINGSQLTTVTF